MLWLLVVLAAVTLVACGGDQEPLDAACLDSAGAIERALTRAPAPVTLPTGTRLSACVANARSDADLQSAGLVLTRAGDHLAEAARRGDSEAALRLGYLVGAVRRGAQRTEGIHAQLQRRIERATAYLDEAGPRVTAAVARGRRAGEASG
jgi:integrase